MHFLTRPVALGQGVVKVGYPQFKSVHAVQKIHLAFFQRVVTGDYGNTGCGVSNGGYKTRKVSA